MRPDPRWNATARPYRVDTIHELVREQAARRPDAVALIDGEVHVSYGVLDAASDEYAVRLADLGVGPGTMVPVVMPRSARLVAVLLAVLKRGAAYGALDPRWPAGRLAALARQCGSIVVAGDPLLPGDPGDPGGPGGPDGSGGPDGPGPNGPGVPGGSAGSGGREGRGGGDWPVPVWVPPPAGLAEVAATARTHEPVAVSGDAPASIFFTSGTTGAPKGVVSPHRGTVRLFQDCEFAVFDEHTVMPQAAPLPWDAFNLELWSTLMNGGTSVLVHGEHLLPGRLREMVARHGVDTLWLTASLFNLYVDEDPAAFDGVRQVMTGGERLSVPHVRRFLDHHPGISLLNAYGPVESTIFATTHPITRQDLDAHAQVPIGRPVANTAVHVLDGDRPCPVGRRGEICIAGDGLAVAYLNDPGLTAGRFTTVDIDGVPTRVYRTGDLGHWSDTGLLHFAGRADRQVKIRGNRIEPAEIERAAGEIAEVGWCAAVPVEEGGTFRRMVLFYRAGDGSSYGSAERGAGTAGGVETGAGDGIGPAEVTALLRARLPGYLVPDEVCEVRRIPLTPTGKLDQRALLDLTSAGRLRAGAAASGGASGGDRADAATPAAIGPDAVVPAGDGPGAAAPGGDPGPVAAPGSSRDELAAVYAEVLDLPAVPHDVPFFALGGDSLAAMRLCTRVEARFGATVPISQLFRTPEVAALAAWLDRALAAETARAEPGDTVDPRRVPLMPMQVGFLLRHLIDPDDVSGLCRLAWWLEGPVNEWALAGAVQDVTERHEALRARYVVEEDALAVVAAGASTGRAPRAGIPAGWEVLTGAPDEDAAWQALDAALTRPLLLDEGEVWRAGLVRARDTGRTLFALAVHHVAFDEWSQEVLCADLSAAYRFRLDEARGQAGRPLADRIKDGGPEADRPRSAGRSGGGRFPWERPAPTLARVVTEYRRQLRHADLAAQREYWRSALRGLPRPAIPAIPAASAVPVVSAAQEGRSPSAALDVPRMRATPEAPAGPVGAAAGLSWRVTAAELAVWDRAAHEHGTTRFAVLLAAYADVLYRLTGQGDLAVGTPVARRGGPVLKDALTCLIDTVCVRLRPGLARDPGTLIRQTRDAAGEALAAADVPFSEVVELVNPVREGTSNPLYRVMFSLHDRRPELRLAGCAAEFRRPEAVDATCDLVAGVWPDDGGGCEVRLAHRTDQVPEAAARAVGEAFATALRAGPHSLRAEPYALLG
ncbi:AMP-binding protein [Sphaerisporangium dianthi]|uniref:AMP-binding protein n=1 Tax=Sphaerisporangium dianthi TaxID=1436120 RepID=A0ABV9CBS3_9ACTN